MCNCPSTVIRLKGVGPCEEYIRANVTVLTGGVYRVHFEHNGVTKSFPFSLNAGDEIVFPNPFNENKVTQFTISDPSGKDIDKCFEIENK